MKNERTRALCFSRPAALAVALIAPALASLSATARAQTREEEQPSWGFEFRAGPYQPKVGSTAEQDYYKLIYASGNDDSLFKNHPLMKTIQVSYYPLHDIGLLGAYVQLGWWKATAPTRVCHADPMDPASQIINCTPENVATSEPGTDTTELSIMPVGAGLIYRFDLLKRYTPVPLVPYGRAGLDYYFWRNRGAGKTSKAADRAGSGATLGWQAAAGLSINLDFLDPHTAQRARSSISLADSYVFGEISMLQANGFGDADRLDMSATLVQVGLALDFL